MPTYPSLNNSNIKYICENLKKFINQNTNKFLQSSLNKKTKKFGNLYLVLDYNNEDLDKTKIERSEKPVYYTMNPFELIEKL